MENGARANVADDEGRGQDAVMNNDHIHCFCRSFTDRSAACCGCNEVARAVYLNNAPASSFVCMCGARFADVREFEYHGNNECSARLTATELRAADLE